jgi:hypothetical protein
MSPLDTTAWPAGSADPANSGPAGGLLRPDCAGRRRAGREAVSSAAAEAVPGSGQRVNPGRHGGP